MIIFVAAGLGYGIVSGAFATVNIFRDLSGPGTVGIAGDSQYFFLISCKTCLSLPRVMIGDKMTPAAGVILS